MIESFHAIAAVDWSSARTEEEGDPDEKLSTLVLIGT
jgi:hypothetical protein